MEFINQNNANFNNFINVFKNKTNVDRVMRLNIYVEGIDSLRDKYLEVAKKHNEKIMREPFFFDAGFDLYLPELTEFTRDNGPNKINFQIRCSSEMYYVNCSNDFYPTGYYIHPRSSLSKTPLRLANSTGIIDAGYRGSIIGMFDCFTEKYSCAEHDRLLQICAPGLLPIYVNVVDNLSDLGADTSRGCGGFGSTGV
jgi:hypothetical protein